MPKSRRPIKPLTGRGPGRRWKDIAKLWAVPTEILRSLTDRVVLTPAAGAPDGINAQLHGDLAAILALSDGKGRKQKLPAKGSTGSQLSLVAGEGNHRQLTLPPIAV